MGWAAFFGIWAFVSAVILDEFTLPGPLKVWNEILEIVRGGSWADDFLISISKTFMGFMIALIVGVPVGYMMGRAGYWKAFFHDGVVGAGSIPGIVYAIIALVIFGIGFQGPILAVGLISMPFIALNVAEGLEGVDRDLLSMSTAFGRSDRQALRHILIPSIMPFAFAGVRLSFAIAWKVEALTEVFGSSNGVGFQIRFAFQGFSIAGVLAWTLMFIALLLLIERGLAIVERWLFRWRTWEQAA